ncbi:uncharacterized protein ARMOST_18666 [Armillaria ostoyae]|uniref:Uncharacterized protein n=1 Tax=Armillaria ostoyae TaxID=47428 RepID=A0A284S2D7_ARMOS|nr:uncharacterized protein ARMOST_18666 [Armillaria ostoyae]
MSKVSGALARTFFKLALFPRPWHQQYLPHDRESQDLADHLSSRRPSNIRRPTTYPCTIVDPENSRKVKVQPLIGTSDDGVHSIPSDIHKLGLSDTGQTVVTRHDIPVYRSSLSTITMVARFTTTYHTSFACQ